MKIIEALARFLSSMMSPLLTPTYGVFLALWVSVLCYIPFGTRLMVLIVVAGITCLLPMIFIALLHNAKIITDKRLVNHRERWLPYIFTLVCYVAAVPCSLPDVACGNDVGRSAYGGCVGHNHHLVEA